MAFLMFQETHLLSQWLARPDLSSAWLGLVVEQQKWDGWSMYIRVNKFLNNPSILRIPTWIFKKQARKTMSRWKMLEKQKGNLRLAKSYKHSHHADSYFFCQRANIITTSYPSETLEISRRLGLVLTSAAGYDKRIETQGRQWNTTSLRRLHQIFKSNKQLKNSSFAFNDILTRSFLCIKDAKGWTKLLSVYLQCLVTKIKSQGQLQSLPDGLQSQLPEPARGF